MKRILSVAILIGMLILPLLFPLTASAEVTTLSASVPEQVTLSVEITGKGTVTVNGQSTSKTEKFLVDRLDDVTVSIVADTNYLLKAVYLDGADVTDNLKNGVLTIENIQFDTGLTVICTQKSLWIPETNPATGDTSALYAFLLCWLASLTMLIVLLRSNRKNNE